MGYMKKVIKVILCIIGIFVLFLILRVIIPPLDVSLTKIVQKEVRSGSEYKTKEECEKNKGDWGRAGLFPQEFCRIPFTDFGKSCIAGFQCGAGVCIAQYQFRNNPIMTTGKCPKYVSIFGCTQEVHFGLTSKGICRD